MKQKEQRRVIVLQIIAMQGSVNPKKIQDILQTEHKIKVSYQTVHNDITHIKQTNAQWLVDAVNNGLQNPLMTLYLKINNIIKQLRELRDFIIAQGGVKKIGEGQVASINKVISEQMHFLKDVTDDTLLYRRLTEFLEQWVSLNKLKKIKAEIELSHNKGSMKNHETKTIDRIHKQYLISTFKFLISK